MRGNTVGELTASGAEVRWICYGCNASGPADLGRILAAKGPAYDLTDKTAACRQPGCTYWVAFYANNGQRNWPLATDAGLIRSMDRRSAWLTAEAERRQLTGTPPHGRGPGRGGS